MRLSIRAATVLDAGELAGMRAQLEGREVADGETERIEGELADPGDASTWLAIEAGRPIGFITARALGPGSPRALEVAAIFVEETGRRQGIGTALLNYAIGDAPAQARGPEDDGAREFFTAHGFAAHGEALIR